MVEAQSKDTHVNECYKCDIKGHWSYSYRTSKKLFNLYQVLIKAKGNEVKMNFNKGDNLLNLTHLDFSKNPSRKIDHLIGDENVCND